MKAGKINHVKQCSCLFCSSCLPEWAELSALKKQTLQFKRGETLFEEGAAVTGMYFTREAAVKVHRKWNGKELIMRWVSGPDVIGVRGFGTDAYTVSATALELTTLCFVPTAHIEASLKVNNDFACAMLQFYARELQQTEQRMSDFAHMNVKGRIAKALFELKEKFGVSADGFIRLAVTRQDIAAYAGTTYETVFKVFVEWNALAIIETNGKYIRLRDEQALAAFISIA